MFKLTFETKRDGRSADNVQWPLACPNCGHETAPMTLTEIQAEPEVVCGGCSNKFKITADESVAETARQLDELDRAFDSIGKRR